MWALAPVALRRYLRLLWQAITSPFDTGRSLLGSLLMIAAFPLLLAWQLLHWIGLALDEVLFRGYRNVEIRRPMFVIGPPRTGTTFLHQVLARDPAYTTFRTWECLFGLSVTARKTLMLLAWLDGLLGRPFGRLGGWLGRAIAGPLDDIHPLGLSEPEEDFLCLMP
ncbi:MAG: sulfotransferase, partial [Pseudomonadota bacterium]